MLPLDKLPSPPTVPGLPILRVVTGSHAYGTDTPESDIDIRGIFVPNREYVLGTRRVEQVEGKPDTVMYALQKYIALARNANPNILELLFAPADCYLEVRPLGARMIESRNLFLSRKARFTYSGYAYSQLKRIETHRRWLLHPPPCAPCRSDYGLPEGEGLIGREQLGAFFVVLAHLLRDIADTMPDMDDLYHAVTEIIRSESFPGWEGVIQSRGVPVEALPLVQKLTGASDNFIQTLQREQAYYRAVDEWKKYQNWLRTRNPARAVLEAKYGFDVKHASHLVRLMIAGETLMRTGNLVVRPDNADDLRRIRQGIWLDGSPITYEAVVAFAKEAEDRMQTLYASPDCPLPKAPDAPTMDLLCMTIFKEAWGA